MLIVNLAKEVHLLCILRSNDVLKTWKTKINRILNKPIKFLLNIYNMYKSIMIIIQNSKVIKFIKKYLIGQSYMDEIFFRGKISLYQELLTNLLFALFNFINSWIYKSLWFCSIGIYYVSLSCIRYNLSKYIKKVSEVHINQKYFEYKGYRNSGFLMLFLNIAMSGMVIQMVRYNYSGVYPRHIIYVYALYTFYAFIISIINVEKYRKSHSPSLSASKIISFSESLMSILTLQTAMITQFGGREGFQKLMNSLVGGGVCTIVFGLAVFMIINGIQKRKEYNDNL